MTSTAGNARIAGVGETGGAHIEVTGLRRSYVSHTGVVRRSRSTVEAVKGIDLRVEAGELFGLLGPNGAGKTTTIKVLLTLLLPDAGTVRVLGLDVVADAQQVRRRVGYVFGGDRGLYDRLSGYDNLRYFAELYAVPAREQRSRIGELAELVGMSDRIDRKVEGYSRGMRQRLHIARGLLHRPTVLFLDEPTIGIDPVGARELRATVATLREQGTTILLTTHYMFEADELCDRIAVIADGRIVGEGTPAELKGRVRSGRVLEVDVFGDAADRLAAIRALPGVQSAGVEERGQAQVLSVRVDEGAEPTGPVLAALGELPLGRVAVREPTLEDAYVEMVGLA
jgi:ABC-2 type transport system ATP-binding protein